MKKPAKKVAAKRKSPAKQVAAKKKAPAPAKKVAAKAKKTPAKRAAPVARPPPPPADALADLSGRPMLLTHGTEDDEDLPNRTEAFAADAAAADIPVKLRWCEGAGHGQVDNICPDKYARWLRNFFIENLHD